jgi:serine/threonine-protein kinase
MSKHFDVDRGRWLAASPYLSEALDLPLDRRDAWLQDLAATQPAIAMYVRRLLDRQTDTLDSFLSGQALLPGEPSYSNQGEVIGNYRVLRELGSGGMAVVYLAERADGHFEQRVALKILHFGADSAEARRHFAQERQILASLNHRSIARLIDGGITSAGLPYLAMEYIEGTSINEFCDRRCASLAERLRLFLQVADAVQYAHHRLIVHRDLKPSNIVVTPEGAVKLLDFGIAKLLDPDGFIHAAPPTRDAVRLLTPEYASPEQIRGDAITTATDVHQLGRLLYELLTGRSPYPVRGRNSLASLRTILECEPRRPSAAISGAETTAEEQASLDRIASARHLTPQRLRQGLRGDLDAILLKALHREPQRRYASVAQFADDVERYLQRQPVSAHDGVLFYRTGKFLRRHVAAVALTALVLSSFVLLIAWYTTQLAGERDRAAAEAQRASAEAQRARREAATAAQMSDFLGSVFRGSRTTVARADTTARELLDRGAERIEAELADQPAMQARLLNVIGNVYAQYDLRDKARALAERALRLNLQEFGPGSLEVAASQFVLAGIVRDRGQLPAGQQLLEEVLRVRERKLGMLHPATADTLQALAENLYRQGHKLEAVRAGERAVQIYAGTVSPYDERAVNAKITLASALVRSGQLVRARSKYQEVLPLVEHSLGPEHRTLAAVLTNLANTKLQLEDYDGVAQQLQRALGILQGLYAPDHSDIQVVLSSLGRFYYSTGRIRESMRLFEQIIATSRNGGSARRPLEATAQELLGQLLRDVGNFEAAHVHIQAATDIWREFPGESRLRYAISLADQGLLLLDEGNPTRATQPLEEAMAIARKLLPQDDNDLASLLVIHGTLLVRTGKAAASEATLREALSIYSQVLPATHREVAAANSALAEALLAQGRLDEAEKLLTASEALLAKQLNAARRRSLQRLIRLYELKHEQLKLEHYREQLADFERRVRSV